MPVNRKIIFDAVKQLRGGKPYVLSEVNLLDKAIDEAAGESLAGPTPAPEKTRFVIGKASAEKLAYVHPKLRQCVELAITLTEVDFTVNQSLRSIAAQKAAVASGNSRTMKSKHLKQADGWVWAVDLVPLIESKLDWSLDEHYGMLAFAMDQAATQLGIAGHVRWGCAWDRVLSDFGGKVEAYLAEAKAYAQRHPGSDLLDGPHFEWVA